MTKKKKEEKIKELKDFIARFSANASKSKQATSRKKILEKIELEELTPSTRRYPYINFKIEKESGKEILNIKDLIYEEDGKKLSKHLLNDLDDPSCVILEESCIDGICKIT